MTTQFKSDYSFINRSVCEVTDSKSTNCKNGMGTEITHPMVLNFFFIPPLQTQTLSIPPQQKSQKGNC